MHTSAIDAVPNAAAMFAAATATVAAAIVAAAVRWPAYAVVAKLPVIPVVAMILAILVHALLFVCRLDYFRVLNGKLVEVCAPFASQKRVVQTRKT